MSVKREGRDGRDGRGAGGWGVGGTRVEEMEKKMNMNMGVWVINVPLWHC